MRVENDNCHIPWMKWENIWLLYVQSKVLLLVVSLLTLTLASLSWQPSETIKPNSSKHEWPVRLTHKKETNAWTKSFNVYIVLI